MNYESINKITDILENLPRNSIGGKKVDSNWLDLSEIKYNLKLPLEYRWFIENYDFVVLWGEPTKTVFPPEYQDDADQDIFNYHELDSEEPQMENKLVFLVTEEGEEYYFPIKDYQAQKEVFLHDPKNELDEFYSEDFLEFLLKEIPKNYYN